MSHTEHFLNNSFCIWFVAHCIKEINSPLPHRDVSLRFQRMNHLNYVIMTHLWLINLWLTVSRCFLTASRENSHPASCAMLSSAKYLKFVSRWDKNCPSKLVARINKGETASLSKWIIKFIASSNTAFYKFGDLRKCVRIRWEVLPWHLSVEFF